MSNKQKNKKENYTKRTSHEEKADSEKTPEIKFESKSSEERENNLVVNLGDFDSNKGASADIFEEKDKIKDKNNFDLIKEKKEEISPGANSNKDFEIINKENLKPSLFTQGTYNPDKQSSPYMIIENEDGKIVMEFDVKDVEAEAHSINLKESTAHQINEKDAFNQASEKVESDSPLISIKQANKQREANEESDSNTPKKSSSNNIPILHKLMSSSENVNFDAKENSEINRKQESNDTKSHIKNNNNDNEIKNNQIINEDEPFQNPKTNRALCSEVQLRPKFEKVLNTNLDSKHQFRICIVGDSNVGKTALLTRYCDDSFKSSMTNTIGVDFRALMLKCNDMNIKLQIWDTAGQERFKSISVNYFKSANGFIFVYDIANRTTFDNLNNWYEIVQQHNKNTICNFVVGNKCDLEENRQVSLEEGKDFAFSKKFNFMETSAKSAKNVDVAFEVFTLKLIEHFNLLKDSGDDRSSNCSVYDGKRFNIDDVYDEITMSKKKKSSGCMC